MARPSKATPDTSESFVFEIGSSSMSYSFGLAHYRDDPSPYSEHPTLKIEARCLHPARFAGRTAKISVLGDRRLASERRDRREFEDGPYGVGAVDVGRDRFTVLAALPVDAIWAMATLTASGSVRHVVTHGPRPVRGKAMVRYITFEGSSFELDDWA